MKTVPPRGGWPRRHPLCDQRVANFDCRFGGSRRHSIYIADRSALLNLECGHPVEPVSID
jgi:hypothetical protein